MNCSKGLTFGNIADIGQTLVTGQPLHIALGRLSPQNGFGVGLAFVEHKDFVDGWCLAFDSDAVATPNESWRAGAYAKAFRLGGGTIVVVNGPGKKQSPLFHVAPLLNLYAQTSSLNRIYFYGLGLNTLPTAQTAFGFTETIAGASLILPLVRAGASLNAEMNGRIPPVRGDHNDSVPSISSRFIPKRPLPA